MKRWIGQNMLRSVGAAACLLAVAVAAPPAARAATCPADKVGDDVTKPVDFKAVGVTDTVIGSIDLAKEPANIPGRLFRMRKLVIAPGGIVPWHSHHDRPAIIYMLSGEMVEYASNCSVPIVHPPGDVTPETAGTAHWWKNLTKHTAVLLSADLLPVGADGHTM
jgi:quercetin dioxygenase-like cupin family protein